MQKVHLGLVNLAWILLKYFAWAKTMAATTAMSANATYDWIPFLKMVMVALAQPSSTPNLHKDGPAT